MRKLSFISFLFVLITITLSYAVVNFPYPQNITYPYGYNLTNVNTDDLKSDFQTWWNNFYEESSDGTQARIKWDDPNYTVSEGIGYGMLMAVYLSDNTTSYQSQFDKLWTYYKNWRNSNGVMNWKIYRFDYVDGKNGATDAELDVALALIMAYYQFGNETYKNDALNLLNAIRNHEVDANYVLKPGDAWNDKKNPSYFSYAALKVFAEFDTENSNFWNNVIEATFNDVLTNQSSAGISSDWYNPSNPSDNLGYDMSYDAIRTPWRVAWGYVWFGGTDAENYLDKIIPKFQNISPSDIKDKIDYETGSIIGSYNNSTFVGGIGCIFMRSSSYSTQLSNYYNQLDVVGDSYDLQNSYFSGSLNILYRLLMSGNMPNLMALAKGESSTSDTNTTTDTTTTADTTATTTSDSTALIDDCEDGDEVTLWGGVWYTYNDNVNGGQSTIDPLTSENNPFTMTAGGANGSAYAAHVTFTLSQGSLDYNPYVGIGLYIQESQTAYDLSTVDHFEYYYKGYSHRFRVETANITDYDYYGVNVVSSSVWTLKIVNWEDLSQEGWGESKPLDKTQVVKLSWQIQDVDGTSGELWLDDIAAPGAIPPEGATTEIKSKLSIKNPILNIYPNPFNPVTTISLLLPDSYKENNITISIYDINGKLVESYNLKAKANIKLIFNGNKYSSGLFFVRVKGDNLNITTKMLLVK